MCSNIDMAGMKAIGNLSELLNKCLDAEPLLIHKG